LWQEIIFTVVNGLTQNQSFTFSKLKLNKKRNSKRLMRLLKIKCTNMIINGVTYMNLIYSGLLLEKIPKTVSFGDSSKTSKSKADESQILNEVQNLFATGQPHR
jgi:hypothetical protein